MNATASPGSSNGTGGGSGGITQILPLKLVADKKVSVSTIRSAPSIHPLPVGVWDDSASTVWLCRTKIWRQITPVLEAAQRLSNNWIKCRREIQPPGENRAHTTSLRVSDLKALFIFRTNSYPKISDHYRLRSADRSDKNQHSLPAGIPSKHMVPPVASAPQLVQRNASMLQPQPSSQQLQPQHPQTLTSQQSQTKDQSQEEIYFWYQLEVEI